MDKELANKVKKREEHLQLFLTPMQVRQRLLNKCFCLVG